MFHFAVTIKFQGPASFLSDRGQRDGFILLLGFLGSFLFIRTSARLMRSPKVPWWPGSVTTEGGLHLHHLVWGICLMLICGFLGFAIDPGSPRTEILAALFGVGAGLTFDEFALWIHLEDVYWADEGRASLDAVVVVAMVGALLILGFAPFDLSNNSSSLGSLILVVAIDVGFAVLAILKGKPRVGLIGILIPLVSIVGAIRLAKPSSLWARRLYPPEGRRMRRAKKRWARTESRRLRLSNAVGGAPEIPAEAAAPPPEVKAAGAATSPRRESSGED